MAATYADILNAFQPAKEITDPKKFSGRKTQVEKGTQLLISGDHAFIYGLRGIGKSSITRQLKLIANGNSSLLTSLDSDLKNEKLDYATCYLTRDSSINNINQLLYRILIDSSCFSQFQYLFTKFGKTPNTYSQGLNLDAQLVSDFWAKASEIAINHSNGLAIFIDEFELIGNHDGFASFLKAGKEKIIFIITGIGSTEIELVRDHTSITRQLSTGKIQLPPMTNDDLLKVIKTAEEAINREICFSPNASEKLASVAQGQPYLLHLIGRQALLTAFKAKSNKVNTKILDEALAQVAKEQVASELENRYLKAIGDSVYREIVLRSFSELCNPNAHTSDVYPSANQDSVTNPSYYTRDLQKIAFGAEIRKDAGKYYSFKDPLFQAYVAATPARLGKAGNENAQKMSQPKPQSLASKQPIEILHFSDIHFGSKHYFSSIPTAHDRIPTTDKPTFDNTIIETITRDKLNPALIVASGDFTQSGTTAEFKLAAKSLNSILEYFKANDKLVPNIITCPGNHDVNWALAKSDPDAKNIAFQAYITFRNSLLNTIKIDSGISPERIYEIATTNGNPNILTLSLNSAVIENEDDHRGYIGNSQISNAFREIEDLSDDNSAIRIAIFHHHLVPVHSTDMQIKAESVMTDTPLIKQHLHAKRFDIALHGHRHQGHTESITSENGNQLLVIGCGSSGVVVAERGEQAMQFNKIVITPSKKKITVEILTYKYDASKRAWMLPHGVAKRIYSLDRNI